MKRLLKQLDYIFVLRPTLFFPVWTVFLAGFFVQQKFGVAATHATNHSTSHATLNSNALWIGVALTLLMGAVFVLNQIRDRFTDHQNRKLFLIAHGHLSPKAAFIESLILIAASFVLAFLFSSAVMDLLFLVIFVITGLLYSFKPFSWKDKPIMGMVTNIAGAFLIFAVGWTLKGTLSLEMLLHAVPYASAVAAVYLYTTLPDIEGDQSSEKMTFAVKYGTKATVYAGLAFEIFSLVTAYILDDPVIFYPAFFSLPFFIWAALKLDMKDVLRAVKYPILFLALAVCVDVPKFFILLVAVYFLSKLYYRFRFGINYPVLNE